MATPSTMLPLGTQAPDFRLPDTDGTMVAREDLHGSPALLVAFVSNHCPYVKYISAELADLGSEYQQRGVAVVAIGANDSVAYPTDGPDAMREEKARASYTFPYLHDATQEVAKAYRAACTPDFFLFDADRRLVYRGQMDSSRPRNEEPPSGRDLRAALDAVLAGTPVSEDQKPSMGCNIKWKPGNEPDYYG